MRPAEAHLTPQEFELLLFAASDSNADASSAGASEAQQHLSGCAACQSVAERYRKNEEKLRKLKSWLQTSRRRASSSAGGSSPVRRPECPEEQIWFSLATGLLSDGECALYVSHAARCDWCGPLLKEAMEDLAQETTQEEQEALAKLPTASVKWQLEMARKLAAQSFSTSQADATAAASPAAAAISFATTTGTKAVHTQAEVAMAGTEENAESTRAVKKRPQEKQKKTGFSWWPKLAFAGAGLAVLAVAAWFVWQKTREPDVNALLAQAYTEKRTIELRMPGAAYAPVTIKRGIGDWPAGLDTAQGIIKMELAKKPDDPVWLQAQARAYLLQWNYEKANDRLDKALNLLPNDPGLLLDKAIALYERAEKNSSNAQIDYGAAAHDLDMVLKVHPDDLTALFNEAIINEKLYSLEAAIEDWNHYLTLDPTSPWAEEARERLQRLMNLKKTHQDSLRERLLTPEEFASFANDPIGADRLNSRIEDYQDLAIEKWLPATYQTTESPRVRNDTRSALRSLAKILASRHQDRWLNDLLSASDGSVAFRSAVASLHDAYVGSKEGKWNEAFSAAASAAIQFKTARNNAGILRAQGYQVFALQRLQQGKQCLKKVRMVEAELASTSYEWLKGQVDIDHAGCFLKPGRFDDARDLATRSVSVAMASNFPVLRLRGIGIACSTETLAGNLVGAWVLCAKGLTEHWQLSSSPPLRAHEFYDNLTYLSENMQWPDVALGFAQESAATTTKPNIQILALQHMARIAIRTSKFALAQAALSQAEHSVQLSSETQSSSELYKQRSNHIYSEVMLAEIEMQRGMLLQAQKRLEAIEGDLSPDDPLAIARSFYQAKAELFVRQGRNDEAEAEFLHAVEIVETYSIISSPGLLYTPDLRPVLPLSSRSRAVIVGSTASALEDSVSLPPDEDAVRESNDVAGRFVRPMLLLQADATREKIRARLGDQEVVNFAGHAFSDVFKEGLLVYTRRNGQTGTTLWTAADVDAALFKKTQLVVLSACSTGRTLQTRRESHGEMVRSLLKAGVPQIVGSRWNIESQTARKFVGLFYNSMLSGHPAFASLQSAQIQLINQPTTNHPYYWAAFAAFGQS